MVMDLRDTFVVCALQGNWPARRPELGVEYVRSLQKQVHAQIPRLPFICLTDREIPGVVTRYLPSCLPGWWSKLYAFSPSLFPLGSRVLVLDLDTVVAGPLDEILSVDLARPVFIRDAWFLRHAGSGVFSFRVSRDTAKMWTQFPHGTKGPPFVHPNGTLCVTDEHWLHQYIQPVLVSGWSSWCELLPGAVLSYKHHLHQSCDPLPEGCRVVYFDGDPRPHDVLADWNPMGKIGHPNG
jgi:hypothetical protein